MADMSLQLSRRFIAFLILFIVAIAIPLTLFLLSQQQDIRQRAAGEADLVVTGFQLTDAGGNVRTEFNVGEEIYVRVRIKNQGTTGALSPDQKTYTQIYSDAPNPVTPNTPSDVQVSMQNGQFGAGAEYVYNSIYGGEREFAFKQERSWNKPAGSYVARIFVNYNGNASESTLTNNQAKIEYTVTSQALYLSGTSSSSKPSDFPATCDERTVGSFTGCVVSGSINGRTYVKIKNNSSTTKKVGGVVYKAYYDYPDPYPNCSTSECPREYDWIWTQTIYSAKTLNLAGGSTTYIALQVPNCNWQGEAFFGDLLLSFKPPNQTYSGKGTFIDGWLEQYNGIKECQPDQPPFPSPTPTPTNTLTPTLTPTLPPDVPTPTRTPSPTPTLTPVPSPTNTPTPTACPVPQKVQNVRIECPFCGL